MTTKQFMKNAKPCPFCGGKDFKITSKKLFDELIKEHGSSCTKLDCNDCDCAMYEFTTMAEDRKPWAKNYGKRLERLLAKWNTRQNETEGNDETI